MKPLLIAGGLIIAIGAMAFGAQLIFSYFFDAASDVGEWVAESFEYDLEILTDEETGCQYIAVSRGSLANGISVLPRLDSEGRHICQR